jgi:hypothetical protein
MRTGTSISALQLCVPGWTVDLVTEARQEGHPMYPTRHAVRRYQERVAPVSTAEAFRALAAAAATARRRSTPRWWTPVEPAPGLLYLYPASMPGVCLLVRDGAILTVFQRSQCQVWEQDQSPTGSRRGVRRRPYRRPSVGTRLDVAA